jgi:uncharacterized protein YoxC
MKKDEAIRLIEEMHDEIVTQELELRALIIIERGEAKTRIEKLEFLLKEREERTEKLREHIKDLESRPTLVEQGRLVEDIQMLKAKLNERDERINIESQRVQSLRAENEKLRDMAVEDMKRQEDLRYQISELEDKRRLGLSDLLIAFLLGSCVMGLVWNLFA